jgi:galactosylceramidase
MKEAKKRNPAVKLYSLSWGAPGWIGNGSFFSDDNIKYHIKWLQGAKKVHGLDMDFIGIWNEHRASSDWIVQLRRAMDGAGFERTAIVATDQGGWPICDVMVANKTVRDAVAVIGSHYPEQGTFTGQGKAFPQAKPTPVSCQILNEQHNKSIWTSEGWNLAYVNDWSGGLNLASTINRNYVLQNQTAMVVWNLIYSWYSILPFAHPDARDPVAGLGHGLMTAAEPWCAPPWPVPVRICMPETNVLHVGLSGRTITSCSRPCTR